MLEQATALVATYTTAIMVAIAMIGIVTATIWTLIAKKRNAPPSA